MRQEIKDYIVKNLGTENPYQWTEKEYNVDAALLTTFEELVKKSDAIRIIGDYDADGICAAFIMEKLLESGFQKANVEVILPDRVSDGYGISERITQEIISELEDAIHPLVITVDNGITQHKAIKAFKEANLSVIVTDHHLAEGEVVDCDLIINPHITGFEFKDYCGAGIAYKIAEAFLTEEIADQLKLYTAIATVADLVPLQEENWVMVREVISDLIGASYDGTLTLPIRLLLEQTENTSHICINEELFGYVLGPIMNASGRMLPHGAKRVLDYFNAPDREKANQLIGINKWRKEAVKEKIERIPEDDIALKSIIWSYLPDIPEGIIGIIAGNLQERYQRPVILLSNTENGLLKGSCRSIPGFHMYQYLTALQDRFQCFRTYGGHEQAAGLSMEKEVFTQIIQNTQNDCYVQPIVTIPAEPTYFTETMEEMVEMMEELNFYAPFGSGNPKPLYCLDLTPEYPFTKMGDGSHISVSVNGIKVVSFKHYAQGLQYPDEAFRAYGNLSYHEYRGKTSLQFIAQKVSDIPDYQRQRELEYI